MSRDANTAMDVLFAGGGSGGHLFPGLAVAAALAKRRPDWRLHFVGSDRPVEQRIMRGQPWPHTPLPVLSPTQFFRGPFLFATANWRAWRTVRKFWTPRAPQVVVGLGGFASVPALWMASCQRTPIVMLEQNAIPGRATRWFAKRAAAVCLGFAEAMNEFAAGVKTVATGNPVRDDLTALFETERPSHEKRLLILGGSQGASGLNHAVMAWVQCRPADLRDWHIVHQAGPHAVAELTAAYTAAGIRARVEEFVIDMAPEYRAATIAICRAGATTLSELACAGLPAIFVPFPQAADDHQRRNADWFVKAGAATCVEQQATASETATRLAEQWAAITSEPARITTMSKAMRQRAQPHAAADVAQIILDVVA